MLWYHGEHARFVLHMDMFLYLDWYSTFPYDEPNLVIYSNMYYAIQASSTYKFQVS